eukprot:5367674-Amphidinium_carterae.2
MAHAVTVLRLQPFHHADQSIQPLVVKITQVTQPWAAIKMSSPGTYATASVILCLSLHVLNTARSTTSRASMTTSVALRQYAKHSTTGLI